MAFFTRFILALFGMAFAVLVAVGVLFWLALYVVFACLRWLMTGQKPQALLMWQQIQAMRKGMQPGTGTSWSSWSHTGDETVNLTCIKVLFLCHEDLLKFEDDYVSIY